MSVINVPLRQKPVVGFAGFYSHPTFGPDLNRAEAGFSGTPDKVHNGTDDVLWTGTALSGTWDFASTTQAKTGTKSVDAENAVKDREAQFERSSAIDTANFTAISGWIYVTSWVAQLAQAPEEDVTIRLRLAGVDVGVSVMLSSHMQPNTHNIWQKFVIPLCDLDAESDSVDQIVVTQVSTAQGNSVPAYFLDDVQFEEINGPLIYTLPIPANSRMTLKTFNLTIAAPLNTTLADAGMNNIDFDTFCGQPRLTSGLQVRITRANGDILGTGNFQRHIDAIQLVGVSFASGGNSTTCWVSYDYTFAAGPTIDTQLGESGSILIAEDLSAFSYMRVLVSGDLQRLPSNA